MFVVAQSRECFVTLTQMSADYFCVMEASYGRFFWRLLVKVSCGGFLWRLLFVLPQNPTSLMVLNCKLQ